jgi:hypothetical protein
VWVVGALLEGIRDPHKFVATTEAAFDSEKPLVVLKVGRSEVARRSVIAHTGSLAGADAVVDAVLRQKGAIRVASPEELIETCALLATSGWPRGGRTPPAGYGVIVGGIEPCSGLPPPTPLVFAAGTVIVMSGGTEVTSTHVTKGSQYRFTLLPGAYVLLGKTIEAAHSLGSTWR